MHKICKKVEIRALVKHIETKFPVEHYTLYKGSTRNI